jgi:hypothetical protein
MMPDYLGALRPHHPFRIGFALIDRDQDALFRRIFKAYSAIAENGLYKVFHLFL